MKMDSQDPMQNQSRQFPKLTPELGKELTVKVKPISQYPFDLSKICNVVEMSYLCFANQSLAEKLQIYIKGYRQLRSENAKFFALIVPLLEDHANQQRPRVYSEIQAQKQEQSASRQSKGDFLDDDCLFVPLNIMLKIVQAQDPNESRKSRGKTGPLIVQIGDLPLYDIEELEQLSVDRLPVDSQGHSPYKDLILQIINPTVTRQTPSDCQLQFLICEETTRTVIDVSWITPNVLRKLDSLTMKSKIRTLQKNAIHCQEVENRFTHHLQINFSTKSPHLRHNQTRKFIRLAKFVPGKTKIKITAQTVAIGHSRIQPILNRINLCSAYQMIFQEQPQYLEFRKTILAIFDHSNSPINRVSCLKYDCSVGVEQFLQHICQNDLFLRFYTVDCRLFATKKQFQHQIQHLNEQGDSLVFIQNIQELENLSKSDDLQPQTIKQMTEGVVNTLQKTYSTLTQKYRCIIGFSKVEIPQQLPFQCSNSIVQFNLEKSAKVDIFNRLLAHVNQIYRNRISKQSQQLISNTLINSFGWVRILEFLVSLLGNHSTSSSAIEIDDKAILSQMQKYFSLESVQNVISVSWDDIGGLETAKEEIIETIMLPTKHPEIFDHWIRPRTGLLFYGPPGTGKTLLGKCIAKECKMGFISVKGPQLLNMYVGQSQKNVRQIVERAKESKPCIVFMDELDALVPKRGNSSDSNQVMDRIVAELLTQMDLASENQIFIIGATNRPDLLDPSILRAGRFDKQIYLGISKRPEDRVKILKAQTRNSRLAQNFDYQKVIETVPQNFTGADFYGLTSKAMMRAVQRAIESFEKGLSEDPEVEITEEDFISASKSVKPSVSEQQLAHYEKLKEQFSF